MSRMLCTQPEAPDFDAFLGRLDTLIKKREARLVELRSKVDEKVIENGLFSLSVCLSVCLFLSLSLSLSLAEYRLISFLCRFFFCRAETPRNLDYGLPIHSRFTARAIDSQWCPMLYHDFPTNLECVHQVPVRLRVRLCKCKIEMCFSPSN
jgi:hypothetical protein